jgi:hypothetical protein
LYLLISNLVCFNRIIKFDKYEFEAAHIIADSKGGPYAIWNLVPSCRSCNGDCKAQNLVDCIPLNKRFVYELDMGLQPLPINQINLKYLMLKLMINWEPSLRSQLKGNTLIEWVKEVYKPTHIARYPETTTKFITHKIREHTNTLIPRDRQTFQ